MAEQDQTGTAEVEITNSGSDAVDVLLRRIRGEFLEMPGMSLTLPQAARLWNLDSRTSKLALHLLVNRGFLTETGGGRFITAR